MKKQFATALLLALTAVTATAQQPVVANKDGEKLVVNPFSGKPLTTEQLQREIEAAKLQTQMLEEQLKQTNLTSEIGTIPLRKAVEAEQARTAMVKEQANQKSIADAQKAAAVPAVVREAADAGGTKPKQVDSKSKESTKAKAKDKAPAQKSESAGTPERKDSAKEQKRVADKTAAAPVFPQLVSVISVGPRRSAVLDIQGKTLVVEDGANTPFGPLVILGETKANIGGRDYLVHEATLSRFVETDKYEEPVKSGAAAPAKAPPASTASRTAVPAGMPTPPSASNALPPLQLPPGVSVLPAPK